MVYRTWGQKSWDGHVRQIRHEGFAGNVEQVKSHGDGWIRVLGWVQIFVEKGQTIDKRT
jgi:hypothetical protein